MNRSEINRYIEEAITFFDKFYFRLPPWAYFSPDEWKDKGIEYLEIKENMLGWDLTDFGSGNFEKTGYCVPLRNGNQVSIFRKPCRKNNDCARRQVTPTHFHWQKMEDIINRGQTLYPTMEIEQ
jgi:D-lyxose ketol-isomerase